MPFLKAFYSPPTLDALDGFTPAEDGAMQRLIHRLEAEAAAMGDGHSLFDDPDRATLALRLERWQDRPREDHGRFRGLN